MYANEKTKAAIAAGLYNTSTANRSPTRAYSLHSPPPYVTLHRRRVCAQKVPKFEHQHEGTCSGVLNEHSSGSVARHQRTNRSSKNSIVRALFSSSIYVNSSQQNSNRGYKNGDINIPGNLPSRARLCASVGDLSEGVSLRARLKSAKVLESNWAISHSSIQPISIASSCWRRNKNSTSASSCGDETEDVYYCRVKNTSQVLTETTDPNLLVSSMAPPQTSNGSTCSQEKNLKLKNATSGANNEYRGSSFMSRFFPTASDKQRRRQEQQKGKRSTVDNITKDETSISTLSKRRLSPPDHPRGNFEDQRPSMVNDARPNYSTASLGRYGSKLKQQLSPPVLVYEEGNGGENALVEKDFRQNIQTTDAKLGVSTLSTSLKTLSQLSASRDQSHICGSQTDVRSVQSATTSPEREGQGNVNSGSYIGSKEAGNSIIGTVDGSLVSSGGGANCDEESHKKARSLIISTLGLSASNQRAPKQGSLAERSTSISTSSSGALISKSGTGGGLAGKISRGLQEFASSGERLMSWKAKLKKTKLENVGQQATGNEEEENGNCDEESAQSNTPSRQDADSVAKTDPLPRAPKYIYKANSIDSNYDMAMGAYESDHTADKESGQQLWIMGDRRPSQGATARPDGFYVGLTLVNNEALQEEIANVAGDCSGLYFCDQEDGTHGPSVDCTGVLEDIGKHYEEIDSTGRSKNGSMKSMDGHQKQYNQRDVGIYDVQQLVGHSGFKPVTADEDGDQPSPVTQQGDVSNSYEADLPPPTRITPFSGVPQAKDGEIVRPIAFRPVASSTGRAQSIPNQRGNEVVVVSPMKQAKIVAYRRVSPSIDLTRSNYDNTNVAADPSQANKPGHNLSAFTPPSGRRALHHVISSKVESQASIEDGVNSECGRTRDSHSMTPGRNLPAQQQTWHQQQVKSENVSGSWRNRGQPLAPQSRPPLISYQDFCRQTQEQPEERASLCKMPKPHKNNDNSHQVQNEYDTIGEFTAPQNRPNLAITPTGNRSFDFGIGMQKKPVPHQQPAPPMRTAASGHHLPQQHVSLQHQPQQSAESAAIVSGSGSQNYGSLGSRNSSGIHITPSPSDSGVAELEMALREKENELLHLRQTMEHNEQAIVRVYQEKEKRWQDKLREWAIRLEQAVSVEQRFLSEVDQLNNERMELHNRVQNLLAEKQGLQRKCKELESELFAAKARLDERRQTNWVVCKQCGSVLTFETRAGAASATSADDEMVSSRESHHLPDPPYPSSQSPRGRHRRTPPPSTEEDSARSMSHSALRAEVESLKMEVSSLRQSLHDQVSVFGAEKRRWEAEKQRVLQYQKLLQDSYNQEPRLSAHSTPTGSVKSIPKEFSLHPHTYGNLQQPSPPYCNSATGANLNLAHAEPELEV